MKSILLCLFLAATMAGCSALSREQITAYDHPNVPAPVYARIQNHAPLGVTDVVDLSHGGVRSSQIMTYLSFSGSRFNLSQDDVDNLRREGVSGDVITYMRENPDDDGGFLGMF